MKKTLKTVTMYRIRKFSEALFSIKEQSIILNARKDITIKDYTVAIGKILEPKNIAFVPRISNSRVCLYLVTQAVVDKLINEATSVKIGPHC